MDEDAIDFVRVYCSETDECFYVPPGAHGTSVTLRISPSRDCQLAGVLNADAFRALPSRADASVTVS